MATANINGNGIFYRDTNYMATSDIDSYHLRQMLRNPEPTDFGPIEIWAMAQKVEMPLYQMSSFGGKNTKFVDTLDGAYRWQTPVSQTLPYVIEDIEASNTTKGIDGQHFRLKLSAGIRFGHGDHITYDKMNGLEMRITDADIIPAGDAYIYTVRLLNNDSSKFLDNKYLANGVRMFKKGSSKGSDYGERYSTITTRAGFREFYNYVGGADAHTSYSISTRAELALKGGIKADNTVPVTEIWRNFDPTLDPSITKIEQLADLVGKSGMVSRMKEGTLSRAFITSLEAAHLTAIANDIESQLMWGQGGFSTQDGADDIRMSVGLWKQLDSAYKRIYNKTSFTMDLFRAELYNFFAGRVEFDAQNPSRILYVQTGMGGMRLVNEAIKREANGSGLVINAGPGGNGISAITGQGMNLSYGYAYDEYIVPFFARLRFKINPAFDNIHTNEIENPLVDGFNLSSYSFIVFDVTDNAQENIFLLKKQWDHELKWFYQNGSMDYMGRNGFQSSGDFSGYRVKMRQAYPAIWVADPSKILKIVMKNPITGFSF